MKELKNNIDKDLVFTELKDAKKWYYPKSDVPCIEHTPNLKIRRFTYTLYSA